jgi:YHS domain-containing protein
MFKNTLLSLIVCVMVFVAVGVCWAGPADYDAKTGASIVAKGQEVGNKICPVSGEKIGQDGMEPATYEYEGKIYNFCCASCIEEFKKNPVKYIKIVEEEMKKH